jgi:hypothetical protein
VVRRLVVILAVFAVLGLAFALAWVSTDWPTICAARGWCDPAGPLGGAAIHK